jgi:DNA-3-methyladenine glycosylase II
MPELTITPIGPFSLAASTRFLEGFTPAGHRAGPAGHLHLAFPVEGDGWRPVGLCVRQPASDEVVADVVGEADRAAVRGQLARILSLDVDGRGFPDVGRRDAVVAGLQASFPGLRPVTFWSPYEAAAWAVIGQRVRMTQAARVKAAMAERLGTPVEVHGQRLHAFPAPDRLAGLEAFPGLVGRKVAWLRGLAEAALDGRLDAGRLRGLAREQALAELETIDGIGRFSAELILLRGAGHPDAVPTRESRLRRAVADAYGLGREPDQARLAAIADGWRPYRTWVALLLRARLEQSTRAVDS